MSGTHRREWRSGQRPGGTLDELQVAESFDVVVVGARCAGSPLGALLARNGLRVAVVERAAFPRDTLSTHVFQAQALAFLDRLGLTEQIRATGAYFVTRTRARMQDVEIDVPWPQRPGDVGGTASVRRFVLDPILAHAASDSGADVRMATKVTGLVRDADRVAGVRVVHDGQESVLKARLVVGADGRNSTVAHLVRARKYNVTANERFVYWAYFEEATPGSDPPFLIQRWDERFMLCCPADSGLYQVIVLPELRELPRFREDLEGSFMEYAMSSPPVAQALSGARRVGKLFGMLRWEGFFREASGPGWVLVGDAGHFKDPSPGQGIQDAFRQVDELAPVIVDSISGSPQALDRALARWGDWRNEDAIEHYWFAVDLGKAGPMPTPQPEFTRRLLERGKIDELLDLLNHRSKPSKVLTQPRLLGATGRLLTRRGCDRSALIHEVASLAAEDRRRKRLNRRPEYTAPDASFDDGETEVEERATRA
jgi:2-polyprenyl-6-methoxyphenol hydroxylase-like FAD-dependent oxidoreductase